MANEVVKVTEVTNVITASLNDGSFNLLAGGTIGGNLQLGGTLTVGANTSGHDVKFFGDGSGKYFQWDASENKALINGNLTLAGDLDVTGTTTSFNSTVVTIDDPVFTIGGDTAPHLMTIKIEVLSSVTMMVLPLELDSLVMMILRVPLRF